MLFMVIERFRGGGTACWQLMEAPTREALDPWIRAWEDLVEFEIVEVRTSADFWEARAARTARAASGGEAAR